MGRFILIIAAIAAIVGIVWYLHKKKTQASGGAAQSMARTIDLRAGGGTVVNGQITSPELVQLQAKFDAATTTGEKVEIGRQMQAIKTAQANAIMANATTSAVNLSA